MKAEKASRENIIQYYHRTEWVYRNYWELDKSMGLHYGFWDETVKTHAESIVRQNACMAEMAGIQAADKVLDAGCGVGGSSIFLAKNVGCEVTGITITPNQVLLAKAYAQKLGVEHNTTFLEMDYTKMDFPDASFDVVWAIESVCHAKDKKAFFSEAFRVLKKGGRLILSDCFTNENKPNAKEEKQLMQNGFHGWEITHVCNEKSFRTDCTALGFSELSFVNKNKEVAPSMRLLLKKLNFLLIPGWLYYKFGGITDTEYMNAYGSYNICKTFQKFWDYNVFIARK